jgi:isoquinoline 1-oxidoreductase subunit alpha
MPKYSFVLNRRKRTVEATGDTPMLWVIRENLRMTGTKYGCGIGVCCACTIHKGDEAIRSCQITVAEAAGHSFTTIEGLSDAGNHACQTAWLDEDVAQCGFCQPGMIMEAAALLKKVGHPNDEQIDAVMSEHVCRCGTYSRMRRAIHRAATEVAAEAKA